MVYKYHPRLLVDYKKFNCVMVDKIGQVTDNQLAADELIITNLEL